jgi:ubiquinone biosynthesis protein Coq4
MQTTTATAARDSTDLASLSAVQRVKRAGAALGKVLANPNDTEQVLELLGVANSGRSSQLRTERFFRSPAGKKLYDERRTIDSHTVDIDALAALPVGTLGHAYATFLRSRGLTPEVFDGPPSGISDPRRSYLVQRMRQTHDLWHVVTGCDTDPAGEVALQAFLYAQTRGPGSAVLAAAGMLRILRTSPAIVRDVIALYRAGARARSLPTFAWEDHWDKPLAEVRAMLGLPVEPVTRATAAPRTSANRWA